MPVVPKLQGPQIQEQGLNLKRQNVQTSRATFGGGQQQATRAATDLARLSAGIMQEEKRKADQIAVLDADQKLSALETKLLYDRQSGAMAKKGKDSFALPDSVSTEFQSGIDEIAQSLSSDEQRESFKRMSMSRQKDLNKQIQRHVSRESQKYDNEVTDSYLKNERDAAIENFHDDDRIGLSIERQKIALMEHADRNGMSSEWVKLKLKEAESDTHASVVNRILDGGADQAAKEYYSKNKDLISGADQQKIERVLEQATLRGEAQRETDKIITKTGDLRTALDKARSIKDPKKRDEVVRRVKSRIADERAAKEFEQKNNFDEAYKIIEESKSMDSVPPKVLAGLNLRSKQALERRAQQLRSGLPVQTDINTYYDLQTMAGTPATRDAFLKTNLLELRDKLSESDFKYFSKLQQGSRKGGNTRELDGIETKNSIVKSSLSAAGIEVGARAPKEDIEKANRFKRRLDQLVVERQEQTGKKITNDELRKLTDDLMVEVVTDKGFFFDTKKRVFELEDTDAPSLQFDDVPRDAASEISRVLRKFNKPVTNENILRMYTERLNVVRAQNGK